ncbi:hypothetical protein PPN31114_01687 [Pandoraea pneumonica]|jgi:hypothetical protein|uniref:Uncharacterized protein n=1 Tax=Pandoraea pneumonica TaxID=2508299 RepID=A0A5E4TUI5_9BURK|nr:hypothetical protein [Pandoraea pneumonica]VVD91530.1 hypothetical protein PPN31114_01687 [Pandoraea pneumonica]
MTAKLPKEKLLQILEALMDPNGLSEQACDDLLLTFCAGCPDPVKARWLIVECLDPMTNEELVDRAHSLPFRSMADVPASELPTTHPLRGMAE